MSHIDDLPENLAALHESLAETAAESEDALMEKFFEQGKLDAELEAKLAAATTKAEIEDLYLPFKPKRRTRAEIAREKGLGPLAERHGVALQALEIVAGQVNHGRP